MEVCRVGPRSGRRRDPHGARRELLSKPPTQDGPHRFAPDRAGPDRPGSGARVGLGLALVGGWLLQDLAVVLTSGRPQDAWILAPHSLLALGGGALFGLFAVRRPVVPLALVATGAWAALPRLIDHRFSHVGAWLPRALFLLVLAWILASWIGRRSIGRMHAGVILGVLGAALMAWLRETTKAPHVPLTICAAAALPVGLALRGRLRAGTELALCAVAAWFVVPPALAALRTERPDLPAVTTPSRPDAPDLLLVVLDTVRADRLGCYGYELPTTPNIDRWVAEHFTLYSNGRATSSWTLPSHASLFTGLLPAEHGATHPGLHAHPVKEGTPTLAQHLRDVGYRTGGIFANNVYLRPRFNLDVGYEHFDDRKASMYGDYLALAQLLGASPRVGHVGYRDGGVITDLALEWLDEDRDEPWFLTLNYMEVHVPNIPPPPYDAAFGRPRPVDVLRPGDGFRSLQYDRELLHLDAHIDRLLRGLEERGLFEDTAIVITADHGEALGDHDFDLHGWTLYEALVRVPLLVKPAGGRSVERVDDNLTSSDVFRLCLELVGADETGPPVPDDPPTAEWYVIDEGIGEVFQDRYPDRDLAQDLLSWVDGRRKTIISTAGEVEVYDLDADPNELEALELTDAERQAAIDRARTWWDGHQVVAPPPAHATREELDRLRHMGYLGEDEE